MAQKATSLGPKPSLFWFFVYFLPFEDKNLFPPNNGYFRLFFSVSLCFSLVFSLPLFAHTHTLSLSLSFSPSRSFPSAFLVFFFVFHYLPCFFAFVSWKAQHQSIEFESVSSSILSVLGGFLSCFVIEYPFPHLCVFLILSCVSWSTSMFLSFKNNM